MSLALTASETKTVFVVRDRNHEVLDVCELYATADRLTVANVDKGAYLPRNWDCVLAQIGSTPVNLPKQHRPACAATRNCKNTKRLSAKPLRRGLVTMILLCWLGPSRKSKRWRCGRGIIYFLYRSSI